jgi:3',5'-cyclic AMP phosphodiesterase CpdA
LAKKHDPQDVLTRATFVAQLTRLDWQKALPGRMRGQEGVEVTGSLFAISDLHSSHPENKLIIDEMRPESGADWLIVAGDVDDTFSKIEKTLSLLRRRYAKVIWTPGNHELWTLRDDPIQLRGAARYQALVKMCRDNDILTPEDEFPIWQGPGGPVTIAPLFLLYDHSWLAPGTKTKKESLEYAYETGVVCADEMLLYSTPYPDRESWCNARLEAAERRLIALTPDVQTVLVGHWPLVRQPTNALRFPEFARWCGTTRTADWHMRFRAKVVVYGHLHIPRTTYYDGVRFEEVSVGYPREWSKRGKPPMPKKVFST